MYAILLYKIELVVLVFLETSQPHTMNNFRVGDFHGNFAFMISSPDCELTDSGYILMISWGSVSQSFNNKFKRYPSQWVFYRATFGRVSSIYAKICLNTHLKCPISHNAVLDLILPKVGTLSINFCIFQ